MTLANELRLALIDDHNVFREALRTLLETHPGLRVVGEADDARRGYSIVDETKPDVVLLDILLPGTDGVAAAREILRRQPGTRVLILSAYAHHDRVREALAAGISGWAGKDQSAQELLDAIRSVAAGKIYIAPRLEAALAGSNGSVAAGQPLQPLSPREREIFDLIIRGFSNEAIAKELSISAKTVETHRAHINKKLEVHSTADLVRYAARHGLLRE